MNKTKSQFFETTNKLKKKLLSRLIKNEKILGNQDRNEREDMATDSAEVQRVTRDIFEHLYAVKLKNLEETQNLDLL